MGKKWLIIVLLGIISVSAVLVRNYYSASAEYEAQQQKADYTKQVYQDYAAELQNLVQDYEQQLEQYYQTLMVQAERDWEEQLAASEAEFTANVEAYLVELEAESAELVEKLRQRYEIPILNAELKLAIVSLSEVERTNLENQLKEMRAEYAVMRAEYEQELNQKLQAYQQAEEVRQKEKLSAFEEANAEKLSKMYEQYRQRLKVELKAKQQKLESDMRRAAAVRE